LRGGTLPEAFPQSIRDRIRPKGKRKIAATLVKLEARQTPASGKEVY
jgi:hypothetical protein